MAEYIERETLLSIYKKWLPQLESKEDEGDRHGVETCIAVLEDLSAADVVPVVHGRWEDYYFIKADCPKDGFPSVRCSVCGVTFCDIINVHSYMYHYCPNCGARMDGE